MIDLDPIIGAGIAIALVIIFIAFVVTLAVYIYMALTMMTTAKRLKTKQPWLAWIPIGNLVLLSRMAKMHWWPVLLCIGMLIPYIGVLFVIAVMVFAFIWMWKVCEFRKRPGWWVLLMLIPVFGGIWHFIMWGILAWSKK